MIVKKIGKGEFLVEVEDEELVVAITETDDDRLFDIELLEGDEELFNEHYDEIMEELDWF